MHAGNRITRFLYDLSECLFSLGQHSEAIKIIEEAIKLSIDRHTNTVKISKRRLAFFLRRLAVYLAAIGQFSQARDVNVEALSLNRESYAKIPHNSTAIALLRTLRNGVIYASKLGREQEAKILEAEGLSVECSLMLPSNSFSLTGQYGN